MTQPLQETPKRRVRRSVTRSSSSPPMIGLINASILMIGLIVILASRCESNLQDAPSSGAWLDSLITPKDLHLPPSVTDQLKKSRGQMRDREQSDLVPTHKE